MSRSLPRATARVAVLLLIAGATALAAPAHAAPAAFSGPPTADPFALTGVFDGSGTEHLGWRDLRTHATGFYPAISGAQSPDLNAAGTTAVYGDFESGNLMSVSVEGGTTSVLAAGTPPGPSLDDPVVNYYGGAFSPSGTTIASLRVTSVDNDASEDIVTVPAAGGTPTVVARNAGNPAYLADGTLLYGVQSGTCAIEAKVGTAAPTCYLTSADLDSAVGGKDASVSFRVTPGSPLAALEVFYGMTDSDPGNVVLATLDLASRQVHPLAPTVVAAAGPGYADVIVDPTGTELLYLYDYPEDPRGPASLTSLDVATGLHSADIADNQDYFVLAAHWPAEALPVPSSYTPLGTPARVLDTRRGVGASAAPVAAGHPIDVTVAGVDGIPADASAVVVNVIGIAAAAQTYLQVYPTPVASGPAPTTSSLNLVKGQTTANAVTVKVGSGGKVRIGNAVGSIGVAADVVGFYEPMTTGGTPRGTAAAAVAAGTYRALSTPARVLDTRRGTGVRPGPLGPGGYVDLTIPASVIPAGSGATAVVLNLGGLASSTPTYVSAYPTPTTAGNTTPATSTLDLAASEVRENLATVTLGAGNSVRIYNYNGSTNVFADAVGYYAQGTSGSAFYPLPPSRAFDTRTGMKTTRGVAGAIGAGASRDGVGRGTITTSGGYTQVGPSASSLLVNLTAFGATTGTYLSLFATPGSAGARPTFSTIDIPPGGAVANAAITALPASGEFRIYNSAGTVGAAVDIAGWFGPAGG